MPALQVLGLVVAVLLFELSVLFSTWEVGLFLFKATGGIVLGAFCVWVVSRRS